MFSFSNSWKCKGKFWRVGKY